MYKWVQLVWVSAYGFCHFPNFGRQDCGVSLYSGMPKSELVQILDRSKYFGSKIVRILKTFDLRTILFGFWTFE